MLKNWGRIRMRTGIVFMPIRIPLRVWIGINMEILIRIQVGIKTVSIHTTVCNPNT